LIGRNGAGKSTLLKVLSKVTEPTSGRVTIYGTIASVLEVGMGFHPELTGRENVFLSGAMFGIDKNIIKRKFDEIVEFSGMKRFMDTPVKHYSSGMYVRLAFSVVVNIDADILLFDEVLSLGDYSFQMKCYEKIANLANSHKTIVIVSHNSSDINALCSKVICLDKGRVTDYGDSSISMKYFENAMSTSPPVNDKSDEGVKSVSDSGFENKLIKKWDLNQAPVNDRIKITKVFVANESRKESNVVYTSDTISINFEFEKFFDDDFYDIGYIVSNMNYMFLGNHLGNSKIHLKDYKDKGVYRVKAFIEKDFFNETVVSISFGIYRNDGNVVYFDVNPLHLKILKDENEKEVGMSTISKNIVVPLKPKSMKWEVRKL
ncbi:MAG: ABC transporter ATP-binding protein, partial [Candidatus Delongbacteria bacterium]|nr:ABC transporter ATP-binding protein [Candidatus Delongbacteria bacterium]